MVFLDLHHYSAFKPWCFGVLFDGSQNWDIQTNVMEEWVQSVCTP